MPSEPFPRPDQPFERSTEECWSSPNSAAGEAAGGGESSEASELMDAVLRETIGRISDEEAHEMISGWMATQPRGSELQVDLVRSLVKHLLSRRFRGWSCPQDQLARLARWLWDDPGARARLELLWNEASER